MPSAARSPPQSRSRRRPSSVPGTGGSRATLRFRVRPQSSAPAPASPAPPGSWAAIRGHPPPPRVLQHAFRPAACLWFRGGPRLPEARRRRRAPPGDPSHTGRARRPKPQRRGRRRGVFRRPPPPAPSWRCLPLPSRGSSRRLRAGRRRRRVSPAPDSTGRARQTGRRASSDCSPGIGRTHPPGTWRVPRPSGASRERGRQRPVGGSPGARRGRGRRPTPAFSRAA